MPTSLRLTMQALRTKEQLLADAITETLRFASGMKLLSGLRAVLYKQLRSQGKMCGSATRFERLLHARIDRGVHLLRLRARLSVRNGVWIWASVRVRVRVRVRVSVGSWLGARRRQKPRRSRRL